MMKKQLKWIIAIVVVIAVILMITYYQLYVTNTVYSAGISSKKIQQFDSSIAKLDKDNTIHQFFTAKRNNMERISFAEKPITSAFRIYWLPIVRSM